MKLSREGPSDVAAIHAVVDAAFPTTAESRLVGALRDAGDVVVSAIAVENGVVLGHAMLSRMTGPFPALALAPVAVRPERQNQKIGTRLVGYALDLARAEDWVAAFVLGAPRFYERFGFSADLARGFQSPYSGRHFMALALKGRLPTLSGRIAHAPAFADLG